MTSARSSRTESVCPFGVHDFDRHGKMLKWDLADTIINSKAKLSYEEVQDLFDGKRSLIRCHAWRTIFAWRNDWRKS